MVNQSQIIEADGCFFWSKLVHSLRLKRLRDTGYRFRIKYFCTLYADKKFRQFFSFAYSVNADK